MNFPPSTNLPAEQAALWEEYCAAEKGLVYKEYLPALARFVHSVMTLPLACWITWAYAVCERAVDTEDNFPVRFQLFEPVLFPALLEGLRAEDPRCARWMSGFSDRIYHLPKLREQLQPFGDSGYDLLQRALRQDPASSLSRQRMIKMLVTGFEYTLHEVPGGILDCQTLEQNAETLADLYYLRSLVQSENMEAEYKDLLDHVEFQYHRHREYLSRRGEFSSYANYLYWWEQNRL